MDLWTNCRNTFSIISINYKDVEEMDVPLSLCGFSSSKEALFVVCCVLLSTHTRSKTRAMPCPPPIQAAPTCILLD